MTCFKNCIIGERQPTENKVMPTSGKQKNSWTEQRKKAKLSSSKQEVQHKEEMGNLSSTGWGENNTLGREQNEENRFSHSVSRYALTPDSSLSPSSGARGVGGWKEVCFADVLLTIWPQSQYWHNLARQEDLHLLASPVTKGKGRAPYAGDVFRLPGMPGPALYWKPAKCRVLKCCSSLWIFRFYYPR